MLVVYVTDKQSNTVRVLLLMLCCCEAEKIKGMPH